MGLRNRLFGKSDDNADDQVVRKKTSYKYDVHISYSTKDMDIANQICYVLEQNNLKCWIAPRNIASGKPFAQSIAEGVRDSAVQVLVFSEHSMASKYVLNEVQLAFNQNKPIIAFKIDESLPYGEMEYYLKVITWIDAYPVSEGKYEDLVINVLNLFENRNDYAIISEPNEALVVKNSANPKIPDVYISYSENDMGVIGEICDSLEDRDFSCWLRDREDHNTGIKDRIFALEQSKALILILSQNSNNINIVNTEVDLAFSREIPIICFKIDESKLEGSLSFYFGHKQCIDGSSDFNKGLNSLIEHVLKTVTPSLPESHITFSSASNNVRIGGVIALSGSLNGESGEISGANIDIYQNGELIDTLISSRSGRFSAVIPVTSKESYEFKAIFKGNDEYSGCESELVAVDVVEDSIQDKSKENTGQGDDWDDDEGFLNLTDEDMGAAHESIPHVDLVPFPAYDGDDAYAFVSYAHRDYEIVYEEIERFHNQGLNIWYDEGIAPGNEWLAEIGEALNDASLFIVFISNNSVGSRYVRKEITFAIKNDIPFIAIHIEKTNLPIQLDLALGDLQAILKYGMNEKEYYRRYTKAFNRIMRDYGIRLKRVESLAKSSSKKEVMDVSPDVVKLGEVILEEASKEVGKEVPELPLQAYSGDEPYIFVSYSHSDSSDIFPDLKRFNDLGYNIWYDEGIAPGIDWDNELEEALSNSSLLVAFISKNSVASSYIRNELNFAISNNIPIVPIYLQETELPAGFKLRLSNLQSIFKYSLPYEDYVSMCGRAFDNALASQHDVRDAFNSDESEEVEYNFTYLDKLIHSGKKEIVLDSDIMLGAGEDSKYEDGIEIDNELELDANGHTIDACGRVRIFNCRGDVTVKNAVLKNGFSNRSGGAIYNSRNLTVRYSTLDSNASNEYGGAIYNSGYVNVIGCELSNNRARLGGAIYNPEVTVIAELMGTSSGHHDVKVNIKNSKLNDNAAQDGGAVYTSQNIKHNPNPDRYDMLDAQKQHGVVLDSCEMNDNEPNGLSVNRRYTRRS